MAKNFWNTQKQALKLADKTRDAYSAARYGREWPKVAQLLLERGYTEREAEAIMRSKWMRWAADVSVDELARFGNTAADVRRYLDNPKSKCTKAEVAALVAGTTFE